MKPEGYLRHAAAWDVRARRDIVRWATGWEGSGSKNVGEGNTVGVGAMVECVAMRGNGSTLGGGLTLGSGTTFGGDSKGGLWTGKTGTGRGGDGNRSGVGGDRVVDRIQLEKRSQILEMAESCLWWKALGTSVMAHYRKLSTWTMRSEGDTVGWVR